MKFGKSFWIKLGIESLLIVFSVLLALALNEYMSQNKEDERTKQALISIREELRENQKIVRNWHQNHRVALKKIEEYRGRTEAYDSLVVNHQFQLNRLFEGTLIPNLVRSTAWETAKSTGILQNIEVPLANSLSETYDAQKLGVSNTADRLISLIFERETHQQERAAQTLVLLQFTMAELVGQESYLISAYDDMLQKLDATLEQ
ncbi:hypothetical protein [Cesiribacter sp. SM1]|uniref:hypothetical protein n=1 Tax=Cesiribacter sp. SM1 TaxID=2861196 RepID=UPI001CD23C63|nr:hypothetical protein [Cesiribacter sp. SM1]